VRYAPKTQQVSATAFEIVGEVDLLDAVERPRQLLILAPTVQQWRDTVAVATPL
jgi:hypothetical protein